MEWWIIASFIMIIIVLASLYWKSIGENNHLTNFALLILLDDQIHAAQKKGLVDLVRTIEARNATELGSKVTLATTQLAARLSGTMLGTAGMLWKLKTAP